MNFERLLCKLCIRGGGPELPDTARLMEAEFLIPNMVCEGCAEKLDGALCSIDGVRQTWADVRHKRVRVRYDPAKVHPERLKVAMTAAGFMAADATIR